MKRVSILGSTGSIGTQALQIIRTNRDIFEVSSLTCGQNIELLYSQILEFSPSLVSVSTEEKAIELSKMLYEGGEAKHPDIDVKIVFGEEGLVQAAESDADIVLNSLMGMRGLIPTIKAIESGHDIALANKETLVAGGEIVMKLAREKNVKILPVDSEHSAIFQSLEGREESSRREIKRIILTASGGPFRGYTKDELRTVTPEMALKHPNWSMGKKITIDSATMMNKGLEVIEAMHLFDVPASKIQILVHPESIVHSGVEYEDTAVMVELGTPDMKVPIGFALAYPDRLNLESAGTVPLDFFGKASKLTFEEPDYDTFKCLGIAVDAAERGGVIPAIMNGANEVLVDLFLDNRIGFTDIPDIIEKVIEDARRSGEFNLTSKELTLDDVIRSDEWARSRVTKILDEGRKTK